MKTNKDYTFEYAPHGKTSSYGVIIVPKGTRVSNMTALGIDKNYHFVNEYKWIDENYPEVSSILKHDVKYYGINVPKEYIDLI